MIIIIIIIHIIIDDDDTLSDSVPGIGDSVISHVISSWNADFGKFDTD